MEDSPKVSIIIPVYNVERFLKRCIDSVIIQSYKNLEIIIIDDGSTDNSAAICDEYSSKDERIKVIHKNNGGLSSARNEGLDIATGDFIFFLDSDDYILPNAIEKLIDLMINKSVDMVICNFMYEYDDFDLEITIPQSPLIEKRITGMELLNCFCANNGFYYVVAWNKLYKKELFKDIRFPLGKVHEDEFVAHLLAYECKNVYVTKEQLYVYVQRNNSIMHCESPIKKANVVEALANRCDFYLQNNIYHLIDYTFMYMLSTYFSLRKSLKQYDKSIIKRYDNLFKHTYRCCKKHLTYKHKIIGAMPQLMLWGLNKKSQLKPLLFKIKLKFFNLFSKKEKIILLDTPTHGNLGDQAIYVSEMNFLQNKFPNAKIYKFSFGDCQKYLQYIYDFAKNSKIFVQGGGFIGSLWMNEQMMLIKILKKFRNDRIVLFPQTIYFYKNDLQLKDDFLRTINCCERLTIAVRDKNSYMFLKKSNVKCDIKLVPDMALSLKYHSNKTKIRNKKILLCLRNDLEKKDTNIEKLVTYLENNGYDYDVTDTVLNLNIPNKAAVNKVFNMLDIFSSYSLVICDRLHAMIFSTITNTPCIAFDNVSHKVSGVYEWIENLTYIICIEDIKQLTNKMIDDMITMPPESYNCNMFDVFYDLLVEEVNKNEH